ncbi:hypothetical protein ACWEQ8_27285 [Streptomyces noursei]
MGVARLPHHHLHDLQPTRLPLAGDVRARGRIRREGSPPEQLVDAICRVHAGLRFVDPALAAEALAGGASPLTGREADVPLSRTYESASADFDAFGADDLLAFGDARAELATLRSASL